jgi:hypothetical protein
MRAISAPAKSGRLQVESTPLGAGPGAGAGAGAGGLGDEGGGGLGELGGLGAEAFGAGAAESPPPPQAATNRARSDSARSDAPDEAVDDIPAG